MRHPFESSSSTSTLRPIRRPRIRTAEAVSACQSLVRELDFWCRERGWPTAGNKEVAEAAVDQVWEGSDDRDTGWVDAVSDGGDLLPDELRRWPARWRYLVAELERGGADRTTAVELVRWGAEETRAATPASQPAA